MSRSFVITLIMCVGFILHSCAVLEKMDGSSKDEIEKFKMSKDEMWNELKKARNENIGLQEKNQRLTDENRALLQKVAARQAEYGAPVSESYELEKCLRGLRIKVLSGDGDLTSAREMSKRLREKGLKIESIHYAPRSNFSHNTVYSKPESQDKAKRLVSCLGGNTIYKPLTWLSVFDIIVVTGKNP